MFLDPRFHHFVKDLRNAGTAESLSVGIGLQRRTLGNKLGESLSTSTIYTAIIVINLNRLYLNEVTFQPIKSIRFVGVTNKRVLFDNQV